MHIISRKKLLEFCQKHGDAFTPLDNWYRKAKKANWQSLDDVQQVYPSADAVGNFTVFNIKGNDYRLIVSIEYEIQIIYVKYILTHSEYDKEKWKNDPYF
jgi:mRNA interferase HigB